MSRCDHSDRLLRVLRAPRRNNYFYGKRLDVEHFRMEQDYGKEKQWLLNRLTLGKGVLCGLRVDVEEGRLCVSPGVAIDGLGREILVPVRSCIDPVPEPDPCRPATGRGRDPADVFHPSDNLGGTGPATPVGSAPDPSSAPDNDSGERILTLWACYRECTTDPMPVFVADCDIREQCAPGTVVESFSLKVTEGAPPVLGDPDWCSELWPFEASPTPAPSSPPDFNPSDDFTATPGSAPMPSGAPVVDLSDDLSANPGPGDPPRPGPIEPWLTAGEADSDSRRRLLCQLLDGDCDPAPGDPCVPLAGVLLRDGVIADIEICAVRPRLYSNAVLLDLILCLASRIDACCDDDTLPTPSPSPTPTTPPSPTPTPTPTPGPTPTPTPSPRPLLRITAVRFHTRHDSGFEERLDTPRDEQRLRRPPTDIEVDFTKRLRTDTVTAGTRADQDPSPFSFLLEGPRNQFPRGLVPGSLSFPSPNVARFEIHRDFDPLTRGRYRLRLFGDPDFAAGRPAIADTDNMRLDGEPDGLPSGDGAQGGIFDFTFIVT